MLKYKQFKISIFELKAVEMVTKAEFGAEQ